MRTTWLFVVVLGVGVLASVGRGEGDATGGGGADIEIVGLGVNCGENSVCDDKSHLACVELQCHCNFEKGFVLDDAGVKCVAGNSEELSEYEGDEDEDEDDSSYVTESGENDEDGNNGTKVWPEDESKWELPENNTEMGLKSEGDEDEDEDEDDDASDEEAESGEKADEISSSNNELKKKIDEDASADENENAIPQKQDAAVSKAETDGETAKEAKKMSPPEEKEKDVVGPNHDDDDENSGLWDDDDDDDEGSWQVHPDDEDESEEDEALAVHCVEDTNCTSSSLGPLSICNKAKSSCECHDTLDRKPTRKTIQLNGKCQIWREIGFECSDHAECDPFISGPAWCQTDKTSNSGFCACAPFHVWDEERRACLPYATQGTSSPCFNDDQCSADEALGPLSRCSQVTGFCECRTALGLGAKRVIEFEDKCVEERKLGDVCQMDQECQASLGASATCHPFTAKCSCKAGHFCNKMLVRPAMSGFTMIVLIAICASVMLGSVGCIVFKRRGTESYAFIPEHNDRV